MWRGFTNLGFYQYNFLSMQISSGSRFMLLSCFFASLTHLGVKWLRHIPAVEVVFFNALFSLPASVVTLRYRQHSVWGQHHGLLLAQGVAGTLGLTLYFFTLQHIPLPSAVILNLTAPMFAAVIGIFIAKEALRLSQCFYFVLSFAGVVLINGFALTEASWYILSGLLGGLFRGLSYNLTRKIRDQEHPRVVAIYSYVVSIPLAGAYLLHNFVALQPQDVLILSIVSLVGYMAHYYSIKAYQQGPIATVSATSYVTVVYALLFGYLFLGEALPCLKLLGLGLVVLGVLLHIFYQPTKAA